MKVVDDKGLVLDNQILVVQYPFENAISAFRVVRRLNKNYETFEYGPIPYTASGHTSGVVPARSYTSEFTFTYTRLLPEAQADMWYFTDKNKIYHVHMNIDPAYLLRIFQRVPKGTTPTMFRTVTPSPTLALSIEFGFFRGYIETVFLPNVQVGWIVANPTNVDLRTYVRFIYGDYEVEFIDKAEVLWNIMKGKIPAHWVPFGGVTPVSEATMNRALSALDAKMVHLQPLYLSDDEAISRIREELGR